MTSNGRLLSAIFCLPLLGLVCLALAGCGATKNRVATEQLLISDAVDRAVAHIDFHGLSGHKVYLDTKYIQHIRAPVAGQGPNSSTIINADYITSAIRQEMMAVNVLLQEKPEDADYIVELRCGAIGSDAHEVVYGVPANNMINSAATLTPGAPPVPQIPEIALAKRNDTFGAAKIGVFAYHRETKEPVWQAGIAQARSTSKDVWLFGAGPFQRGSIYDAPRFAGSKLQVPLLQAPESSEPQLASFRNEAEFDSPADAEGEATPANNASPVLAPPANPKAPTDQEPPSPEPALLPE